MPTLKIVNVTHTFRNGGVAFDIHFTESAYNQWLPYATQHGYTINSTTDGSYSQPADVAGTGDYSGGVLSDQTLTANTAKTFTAVGLSRVMDWSFKDADGNFIDMVYRSLNSENTQIEVTATDNYTGLTIYYHGRI